MENRLQQIEQRYIELTERMSDPLCTRMPKPPCGSQRTKRVEPIVAAIHAVQELKNQLAENNELFSATNQSDTEMRELIRLERCELEAALVTAEKTYRLHLFLVIRMMIKTFFWKFAAEPAVMKRPCLPMTYIACIWHMPRIADIVLSSSN